MEQNCSNCHFCRRADNEWAYCHRHAPAIGDTKWPTVKDTDWCGEWYPNPETLKAMTPSDSLADLVDPKRKNP